ncbi:MAG: class I SAM-dependent methyltransferase, partial [Fimbriimonadales bacterium]|nr:class I SAM-dependent methyltransferase [Fimbriimonadales bacterium]
EVTPLKLKLEELPPNLHFELFDGFDFPLPDASVDLAYSNQVLEHLHPEDAERHLREVYRVLRPNGRYLCITPYRHTGPHDVSKFFTEVASGLHLKEYTYRDLSQQMRWAGFCRRSVLAHRPTPLALILVVERFLEFLPYQQRRQVIQKLRYPNLRGSIAMIGCK